MVDPTNVSAINDIKSMTGFKVEAVLASETAIMDAIQKHYGIIEDDERKKEIEEIVSFIDEGQAESVGLEAENDTGPDLAALEKAAEEAPVVKLVNYILTDAIKRGASDIHMEPYEKEYRVRYRIDGMLQTIMNPPNKLRDAIISRVKTMAKLNLLEKRLPQHGRIRIKFKKDGKMKQLDFRVSVLPTLHGENIVMRLLDRGNLRLNMNTLGFEPESLAKFQKAINRLSGIVLVVGPAGSGKTNLLYAALAPLNKPGINITTIEEPVEYQFPGVNQLEVNEPVGLSYAAALRSLSQHNPDVIVAAKFGTRRRLNLLSERRAWGT